MKSGRIREYWDTDPEVSELIKRVNDRLTLRSKSAVMRLAIIGLARKELGDKIVDQVLDQGKRAAS